MTKNITLPLQAGGGRKARCFLSSTFLKTTTFPYIDDEQEERVLTGNKEQLKSGSVMNRSGPMLFILLAVTVLLRIKAL